MVMLLPRGSPKGEAIREIGKERAGQLLRPRVIASRRWSLVDLLIRLP